MKIGLVLDDTLDTPDGVQQYVLTIGRWLSMQGHEIHYLVGNTKRTDVINIHSLSHNLHVRFNGNRMSMPLPASRRKLKAFLQTEKFDVLHVQVPYSPFMAGQLLSTVPSDTAVIGTFHILPYSSWVTFANQVLAKVTHRSGRRFDRMIAVSDPARIFAQKIYGYESDVIPNPVTISKFNNARSHDPTITIVFLGRLVERKGAQLLLQAIAYLHDNNLSTTKFKVVIGGKGDLHNTLRHYITEHALSSFVTLQGFINEINKADFLAQADIAVYPSTGGESFGIVLLEAMVAARGVVIAGNNPGYASVMQPYPNQLVNPTDIPTFANKLAWYLEHKDAREQASKQQKIYVKQFDISVVGRQLLAVYERALQSRRQS